MTDWRWYCKHCRQELERGEDAIVGADPEECIRAVMWGGDACGYIVCKYCRNPASEVGSNVVNRHKRGEP